MILVIVAGLSTFAMLAAWFVRVDSTTLWPLGEEGHDAFWGRTMPWPRGVQEDDEIAWHVPVEVPRAGQAPPPAAPAPPPAAQVRAVPGRVLGSVRPVAAASPVPPTRPQRRIARR